MATFDEVAVEARVTLTRARDGSTRIRAEIRSLTAEGMEVRTFREDITDRLNETRVANASDLLDAVVARAKTLWAIP